MYFQFKLRITWELKQNTYEPCNASTHIDTVPNKTIRTPTNRTWMPRHLKVWKDTSKQYWICGSTRTTTGCAKPHASRCFKFLRDGSRGCNKLDCTYAHSNMGKTDLTTGRCDRKNCLYSPTNLEPFDRFLTSQLQVQVGPPFLVWN